MSGYPRCARQSVRDPGDTTTGVLFDDDMDDRPALVGGRHAAKPGRHARRAHPLAYPLAVLAGLALVSVGVASSLDGSPAAPGRSTAARPSPVVTQSGKAEPDGEDPGADTRRPVDRADRNDARPVPVNATQTAEPGTPGSSGASGGRKPCTRPSKRSTRPQPPAGSGSQPPADPSTSPSGPGNPSEPPVDATPTDPGTGGSTEPSEPSDGATEPADPPSGEPAPSEGTSNEHTADPAGALPADEPGDPGSDAGIPG